MAQQINLYNPAFIPPREWLTAKSFAVLAGVLLAVVSALSIWTRDNAAAKEAQMAELQSRQQALQVNIETTRAALDKRVADPALVAAVADARREIEDRAEILTLSQRILGDGKGGYSPYLRALARQSVQGVWLTAVTVADDGERIGLRGRALDKSLLPTYVRRLNGEPAFDGKAFSGMQVTYHEPDEKQRAAARGAAAGAVPPQLEFDGPQRFLEFELQAISARERKAGAS